MQVTIDGGPYSSTPACFCRRISVCPWSLFDVDDNHYHLNGSSWRGRWPRGGGFAGIGWFSYFIVIIIMYAGH